MSRRTVLTHPGSCPRGAPLLPTALLVGASLFGTVLFATALAAAIDPAHSNIGFVLKTRWGQALQGQFPRYQGEIATLADGRHQVRLQLSARAVEIIDHPTYTQYTRGSGFFDADRYPYIEFVSDPYPSALMHDGGTLGGQLRIRDVSRREMFSIAPSACERVAVDCDVVVTGAIDRSEYGVSRWGVAVSNRIEFQMQVRIHEAQPE